ncbi:hypothetical protein CsatB_011193 [Cannabis sativa]
MSDLPEKKRTKGTSMVEAEAEDRISKLPDAIIVHILSFLPTTDVVQTCILSKRWKFIWFSVLKLSFSDTSTTAPEFLKFQHYVDNCLEHRKKGLYFIADSAVTSFKLQIECYRKSKARSLDKWLSFSVDNKIKELSLSLEPGKGKSYGYYYYCLPKTVSNLRALTILELSGIELRYSFGFPSLKFLSLERIRLADNDVLSKSLLDCPSLEKLVLSSYKCLSIHDHPLRVQSSSLKFMIIEFDGSLQVEAINLESLVLRSGCFKDINLSACMAIRNLSLSNCKWGMTDQSSFEDFILNLPLLEDLTLENVYCMSGLEHLKISNQHLKCFKLRNTHHTGDMVMDFTIKSAPKLVSFYYEGNINCRISLESPNLLNGKFVFDDYHYEYATNWFIGMMNFFLNFNCSWDIVTLHLFSDKAFIMPDNWKRICRSNLLNWKHLRLVITHCYAERKSDLEDVLIWISPSLKTLSVNGENIF